MPLAADDRFGVVKTFDYGGTKIDENNRLCLLPSNEYNINNRESSAAIVPTNLDYAVKAAMCDGKGAAWTAAEQQAARDRMGIDKPYELIEEIVLDEGVKQFSRTLEPNGTAYNFRKMYVNIMTPQAEESGAIYSIFNGFLIGLSLNSITTQYAQGGIAQTHVHIANGLLEGYGVGAPDLSTSSSLIRYVQPRNTPNLYSAIHSMIINSTSNMPVGTKIQIYGVRA